MPINFQGQNIDKHIVSLWLALVLICGKGIIGCYIVASIPNNASTCRLQITFMLWYTNQVNSLLVYLHLIISMEMPTDVT
jgi:hypothetical protein